MIRQLALSLLLGFSIASAQPADDQRARPKLGLVLSGGGARGLAHVGVLKVLEREHIPVDVIAGTSMGAIVGGLYASGLSAEDLERELLAIGWGDIFATRVDRPLLPQRRKEEDFEFSPVLEFGLRDGELRAPQGTLSARGLEVLLRRLTLPVRDIHQFDALPIPFRAVATDMETGSQATLAEGDLALALRSSMSVPGVFAPTEWRGRLLGDGGLVDNLPVDVARDMGAQALIVVNVGTPLGNAESLRSIVGLTGQMIAILIEQNVQRSLNSLWAQDLLITPSLGRLTSADFERARDFIAQGETAAERMLPALRAHRLSPEAYARWRLERMRRPQKVPQIAAIRFEGAEQTQPERFKGRLESQAGQLFDAARAERDVRALAASGDYARVDYSVEPGAPDASGRPTADALTFLLEEKPWGPNYFSVGLDLSTDFAGQSAFNLRVSHNRHWLSADGAEWRNQLSLGQTPRLFSELYTPLGEQGLAFAAAWAETERRQIRIYQPDSGEQLAQLTRFSARLGADIGQPFWNRLGEVRLGLLHERWRITPKLVAPDITLPARQTWAETGVRLRTVIDQLDYAAFPQRGYRVELEAVAGRVRGGDAHSEPFKRFELQATDVASRGPHTLNLHVRLLQADQPADSTQGPYTLGGFQQLSGYEPGQLIGRTLAFGRATYYLRLRDAPVLSRGFFVGGSLELGNAWANRSDA
ncbi:MAG TPA: patatin-like phospholipase family protein, partial [Burkholderiaceae bacterium]